MGTKTNVLLTMRLQLLTYSSLVLDYCSWKTTRRVVPMGVRILDFNPHFALVYPQWGIVGLNIDRYIKCSAKQFNMAV